MGLGFSKSCIPVAVLPAILGALEVDLYPGFAYMASTWYGRQEVQKRLATVFFVGDGSTGFGNIVCGIIQITRYTTYTGWRWICITEGSITAVTDIVVLFSIIDFPDSLRNIFLTQGQTTYVKVRLQKVRGGSFRGDSSR